MTKVTIDIDGIKATIESTECGVTLDDLLVLVHQAITGVGYYPPANAELTYYEQN